MLREFDKMFLCDTLEIPYSNLVVYDEIYDQGRWTTYHEVVFEYEGKFWRADYRVGSTESQDEGPWEYEDTVTCTEVVETKVLKDVWVPVEELEVCQEHEWWSDYFIDSELIKFCPECGKPLIK